MTSPATKTNLKVLLASIIITLLLTEAGFRTYYSLSEKTIGADEEEICAKNTYAKTIDQKNPLKFSPSNTKTYEYWNYTGIRPVANLQQNKLLDIVSKNGTRKTVTVFFSNTNAQHLRAIHNNSIAKDPKKIRIATLGDSFTWGSDTLLNFSYPAILENIIPSEVLNFGIEGIGLDTMYLRWKYDALSYKPDVTIFAIYIDDIRRMQPCIYKPKFILRDGQIETSNLPPPTLKEISEKHRPSPTPSYFLKHLQYQLKYRKGVAKTQYDYGFSIAEPLLKEVKTQSAQDGTYFMVVIIEALNDRNATSLENEQIDRLKQVLTKLEIPFITAQEIFSKESYTPHDRTKLNFTHFNPEGYAFLAQGIKNHLEQQEVIAKQKDFNFSWTPEGIKGLSIKLVNKANSSDIRFINAYAPGTYSTEQKRAVYNE